MKILITGCSFSSGWGVSASWPDLLGDNLAVNINCVAESSSSNQDIFIKTCKNLHNTSYDLILVQWSALNRITVSPSSINSKIVVSHNNQFLKESLPNLNSSNIDTFVRVFTLLNQDWKHYFDLIDMIEYLQNDSRIYFINALLPWDNDFFDIGWDIPLIKPNQFLSNLLQVDEFDDVQLKILLESVIQSRDKINKLKWINLTQNWNELKVDVVSHSDPQPGNKSQMVFANQVADFIKKLSIPQ